MSLFYRIPWSTFKNNKDVAIHAISEAQKRIDENRLSVAVLGGPGLFKKMAGGRWLQSQGVEVLQVAGDEVDDQIEIWVGIYNEYTKAHTHLYYFSRPDLKSLEELIAEAYSKKD